MKRILAWVGRIRPGEKVITLSNGTRLLFDGTPAPEPITYEVSMMNVSDRLLVLTRQIGERPEVLGPRTVRVKKVTPGIEAALGILRQRLVEIDLDRHLLVSTQVVAYRLVASPDSFICPVCYALAEDRFVATRSTHYPMMHGQLHHTVRCNDCRDIIVAQKGD